MSTNLIIILALIVAFFWLYKKNEKKAIINHIEFIALYEFPKRVTSAVLKTYPHLNEEDAKKVIEELRNYFIIAATANGKMVSMPSQVVDVAWHEFLLFTKQYSAFCEKAFGRFFHHHPTEAMQSKTTAQNGMKLTWKIACKLDNINPSNPKRLPMLFAIDSILDIPDGFKYVLNCSSSLNSNIGGYCASHIGCSGGCGGIFGDNGSGGINIFGDDTPGGPGGCGGGIFSCSGDSADGGGCGGGCGGGD